MYYVIWIFNNIRIYYVLSDKDDEPIDYARSKSKKKL